jgi:hypothetical protein
MIQNSDAKWTYQLPTWPRSNPNLQRPHATAAGSTTEPSPSSVLSLCREQTLVENRALVPVGAGLQSRLRNRD